MRLAESRWVPFTLIAQHDVEVGRQTQEASERLLQDLAWLFDDLRATTARFCILRVFVACREQVRCRLSWPFVSP